MNVLTQTDGWILLLVYALAMVGVTWMFSKGFQRTKSLFLLAGRSLGPCEAGFSISATWIWAPALFIAAQKAYTQGIVGVFWFTFPNVACLIIFAHFAAVLRQRMPDGFTVSDFALRYFSPRVQNLYLLELSGLAVCSYAVQLLAGGAVLSSLTGIPYLWVTVALALVSISYSIFAGLKASVVTDYAQMMIIYVVALAVVPWAVANGGGWSVVAKGLGGVSGEFGSLFTGKGIDVFFTFGIPVTIGLLAGPFGDQSFWQRAFAVRPGSVKKAFVIGALAFAPVPVLMSILGFLAAGNGLQVSSLQLTNIEAVLAYLPVWVVFPFTFMLLSGLVSTLDSNISSFSSLVGHDLLGRMSSDADDEKAVQTARMSMVFLVAAGLIIANIPGMKILYLFLFYGTLRASTLLPTALSILNVRLSEKGVFYGIVVAIFIGLPIFAYGKFMNQTDLIILGSLGTVLVPAVGGMLLPGREACEATL